MRYGPPARMRASCTPIPSSTSCPRATSPNGPRRCARFPPRNTKPGTCSAAGSNRALAAHPATWMFWASTTTTTTSGSTRPTSASTGTCAMRAAAIPWPWWPRCASATAAPCSSPRPAMSATGARSGSTKWARWPCAARRPGFRCKASACTPSSTAPTGKTPAPGTVAACGTWTNARAREPFTARRRAAWSTGRPCWPAPKHLLLHRLQLQESP